MRSFLALTVFLCSAVASATDVPDLASILSREIVGPLVPLEEVRAHCESKIVPIPVCASAAEWESHAARTRQQVLDRVVFRGEAAAWRDAKTKVEWLDTIAGGPGYRIKKLRYEALPGLWIPALLYEPENVEGKRAVMLAVNGHDGAGKAAPYKQLRAINLAKRGMIVLNVEWLGMGQLRTDGFNHARMNQLDLCGTSGLAPFYLNMTRGLDVLLAHPNADPKRVGVSGLSGGGWQTIIVSSLDTRVTLCNPVAGYSSYRTRARHPSDLGDSEQTPVDLGITADYGLLTAMLAPRPALLTYNLNDNCCFKADHALPPLLAAARPIYALYGKGESLRSHVNVEPGNHNYEVDNREALYRLIGYHFFTGDKAFNSREILSESEVKKPDELQIPLPELNLDFNKLAKSLAAKLPKIHDSAASSPHDDRKRLAEIVRSQVWKAQAQDAGGEQQTGLTVKRWRLKIGDAWTVPALELTPEQPKGTTVLLADAGRKSAVAEAQRLLDAGQRVVAVDPFYFGESQITERAYLYALLVSTVGDRPLGIQAGQVAAVARWLAARPDASPVTVATIGPRTSLIALVAAGLEDQAIAGVELTGSLGSLKELIETNRTVAELPEMFCFGLLEGFDIEQLKGLVSPRPVALR